MAIRSQISELIVYGFDVLQSTIGGAGAILVQIGDAVNSVTDGGNVEWLQHTGFRSRPQNPQAGSAGCQGIGLRRSDVDAVFATQDLRHSSIWQDLNPDEAQIYSFGGSCRVVCRANGKVQIPAQEIDLGSLNPSDTVARASKVDGDFNTVASAAATLNTAANLIVATPPVSLPTALADITSLATMLATFSNSISSFNATGSSVVKLSG